MFQPIERINFAEMLVHAVTNMFPAAWWIPVVLVAALALRLMRTWRPKRAPRRRRRRW